MKRRLKQITENGKTKWRITNKESNKVICLPCEKMRNARKKAEKITAEIEAEKLQIKDFAN